MTPTDRPGRNGPAPWSDLSRPPLHESALRRALVRPGGLWTSLDVVQETGSTNADLAARAPELPEGTVLVAEEQLSGRGRLDRRWSAPARSGIFFSVLLRPTAPVEKWGWLPLLTGVAGADGLAMLHDAVKMGASVVGACPDLDPDPTGCAEAVLDAAAQHGCPVDLHTDGSDPVRLTRLAAMAGGLRPGVTIGPCDGLGRLPADVAGRTAEALAAAGITVVAGSTTSVKPLTAATRIALSPDAPDAVMLAST